MQDGIGSPISLVLASTLVMTAPPLRVPDEHDRAVHGADELCDRLGIGGEAAQGVGGGDHVVAGILEVADDAVPARGLGERSVSRPAIWDCCGAPPGFSGSTAPPGARPRPPD
jgi:hypothetical protein